MNISKIIITVFFAFGFSISNLFVQLTYPNDIELKIFKLLPTENYVLTTGNYEDFGKWSIVTNSYGYKEYFWYQKRSIQNTISTINMPRNFLTFNINIPKKSLKKLLKQKKQPFSNKWVSGNRIVIKDNSAIFSNYFIGQNLPGSRMVRYNYSNSLDNPFFVSIYFDHSKVSFSETLSLLIQKLGPPSSYSKTIYYNMALIEVSWYDPESKIQGVTLESNELFTKDFQLNPLLTIPYSITICGDWRGCVENE